MNVKIFITRNKNTFRKLKSNQIHSFQKFTFMVHFSRTRSFQFPFLPFSNKSFSFHYKKDKLISSASFCSQIAASFNVQMTDSCINRIKLLNSKKESKQFLRLMVEGGGCSGYQYQFSMDSKYNPNDDITFEKDGEKLVIDKISLPFLDGAVIDYKESMIRNAFQVVKNEKAELSCSCGTSFSPKV